MNEEWIQIKGYENLYEINKQGEIRSLHKRNFGIFISRRIDRAGYYTVRLSKNGRTSTAFLHKLLGIAFLPNPDNKKFINHIDGNKLNFKLSNLEWCTASENMKHAYQSKLINIGVLRPCKKVIDVRTKTVYPSIAAACKKTNLSYSHFKRMLTGNVGNNTCFYLV